MRQERLASGFDISFDVDLQVLTINGFRYAASLFDKLHQPTPEGIWLRITSTDGGVITLEQRTDLVPRGELDQLRTQNATLRELVHRDSERTTRPDP